MLNHAPLPRPSIGTSFNTSGRFDMIINCTRRLCNLPSGVSLPSTGRFAPWPMNRRTTLKARTGDSSQLDGQSVGRIRFLNYWNTGISQG
jgi:hypothetical protein